MSKSRLLAATALRSIAASAVAFVIANPALAQDTPEPTPEVPPAAPTAQDPSTTLTSEVEAQSGENANTSNEVVVTGSRIRRPNLESTVPITSIGGETLFQQGDTNIGDTLNELPQLRSTFSQQNPGLGIGIAGLNLLDLRGLGTKRTLTLVNGRRHVGADILNSAVSPDVNSIPNDLIERVDIVTGGNSAIYGSDAIAGVVNFILRRDYEGLQVRGQAGVSPHGFGGNQYVSAMYGHNFADGRANVTVHGEFANQERYFASGIPWLRQLNSISVVDTDPGGAPNGSDGFPDAIFLQDIRNTTIHRFGLVPIVQPAANPLCGRGTAASIGAANTNGIPYNCTFIFQPGGTLVPQTGTRYGSGGFGGIIGGNGQTGREDQLVSIAPDVQRYNFNFLAHYTVSDAFEPFIEAKHTRINALGNNAGPSFIQGGFGLGDLRERVRLDNPFLGASNRTLITNAILTSGCNTSLSSSCTSANVTVGNGQNIQGRLTADDIALINSGEYRFLVARQLADVGLRDEDMQRDTFRIVGGTRGTFNDDWSYEASLNYGKYEEDKHTTGYIDTQRFSLAMDAGINPLTGQIQCRSQFDPDAALGFDSGAFAIGGGPNTGQQARLAADIAACVPYNPFGASDNSAAVDYFSLDSHQSAEMSQFVASAFVSGDSSQLFELPGGPIRFAVGAEYRKEKAEYLDDPYVLGGDPLPDDPSTINPDTQINTNAVVIGNFNPPAFKVKELFGELQVPILKDLPFMHELTLSGAARYAKYSGAAEPVGSVWAYNVGGDWAPVQDLRFRANYSRAVRAPNMSELFFPPVPNFAPGFQDPCAPNQIGGAGGNRVANCTADLGPLLDNIPDAAYSLPVISGSNPLLIEETADSWTVGGVLQPRFIPGLSLSVDYYSIKVSDVIVALTAQQIANLCYDQASLSNVFCGLFERWRGPGQSPGGFQPGQILENSLIAAGVNFASRKRKGIDVNAAYRTNVGAFRYNTNFIFTHNIMNSNFENPDDPGFENRNLGELGDPENEFRWDNDISHGPFTLGYRMRYVGRMWTGLYELFNELPAACGATCPPTNADAAEPRRYPAVFYHDLRFQWDVNPKYQFYFGVDNLLDTHPPLGVSGTGTAGTQDRGAGGIALAAIYDAFGRKAYAGFRARF